MKHVDAGEKIELYPVEWNELVQLCLHGKLRQVHMMHAVLCMEFNPAAKAELAQWLQN